MKRYKVIAGCCPDSSGGVLNYGDVILAEQVDNAETRVKEKFIIELMMEPETLSVAQPVSLSIPIPKKQK